MECSEEQTLRRRPGGAQTKSVLTMIFGDNLSWRVASQIFFRVVYLAIQGKHISDVIGSSEDPSRNNRYFLRLKQD